MRLTRREWLFATASGAAGGVLLPAGCSRRAAGPDPSADPVARFPGKVPMRVINDRPPCLETPWRYFREDFTPNDAFYVRWHLQAIPTAVDLASWNSSTKPCPASPPCGPATPTWSNSTASAA